jgi:asparaginyl-tRNA synthetase
MVVQDASHVAQIQGVVKSDKYPIAKKYHTVEHLRTYAHLRPRTNFIGCIARIRSALSFATHLFF